MTYDSEEAALGMKFSFNDLVFHKSAVSGKPSSSSSVAGEDYPSLFSSYFETQPKIHRRCASPSRGSPPSDSV